MNRHAGVRRVALLATGAVVGGLGSHVYRRRMRTPVPRDPYRDRVPYDKAAWLPYHRRRDEREQLWADLRVEIKDGVNAVLTRLTLGLYRPEPMEPQGGHAPVDDADTVPRPGSARTLLRVTTPMVSDN